MKGHALLRFCISGATAIVGIAAGFALRAPASAAPIPVPGTMTYAENFDALGTTARAWTDGVTLPGWYLQANDGLTAVPPVNPSDGNSGNLNGFLNLGSVGATDRALGSKAASAGDMANLAMGVQFRNTSGQRLLLTRVSYTGELWRSNSSSGGRAEEFHCYLKNSPEEIFHLASGPNSSFPIPGLGYELYPDSPWISGNNLPRETVRDGNVQDNRSTVTFRPQRILDSGEYMMCKWTDTNLAGTDGQQGIDDVSLSFRTMDYPGDRDPSFFADASPSVRGITVQRDGRILIHGSFGVVGGAPRPYAARLFPDGSLDAGFFAPFAYQTPGGTSCAVLEADGSVFLAGDFHTSGDAPRANIVRVDRTGAIDVNFRADTDEPVTALLREPDGSLLIGGRFNTVNGSAKKRIARLHADGILDSSFGAEPDGAVLALARQPDAKILIAGSFAAVSGLARPLIARLHPDGTVDETFEVLFGDISRSSDIRSILIQPDGRILLSGRVIPFAELDGPYLGRLLPDGSPDPTFATSRDVTAGCLSLQADGRIVGTGLTTVFRYNPDGTRDSTFDRRDFSSIYAGALQADGRMLVGGSFNTVFPGPARSVARLLNDPAPQWLGAAGVSRIEWRRGGTAPETIDVTFEVSVDGGEAWAALGSATRFAGGWKMSVPDLPPSGMLRARGSALESSTTSSGLLETVAPYAVTELQRWRLAQFGALEISEVARDDSDADHDGIANVFEFVLGLDPLVSDTAGLPAWRFSDGDYVLQFTAAAESAGLTVTAEFSTGLDGTGWTQVPNSVSPPEYLFYAPVGHPRLFLRLRASAP